MKDKLIQLLRSKIDSYKANEQIRQARAIRRVSTPYLDQIVKNHQPGETPSEAIDQAIALITQNKKTDK